MEPSSQLPIQLIQGASALSSSMVDKKAMKGSPFEVSVVPYLADSDLTDENKPKNKSLEIRSFKLFQNQGFDEKIFINTVKLMRSECCRLVSNGVNFETNGNKFYHIKREELPTIKDAFLDHDDIRQWWPVLKACHEFLDGEFGIHVARQINKLIARIDDISEPAKVDDYDSRENILLNTLSEFEALAGFSEQVVLDREVQSESIPDKFGSINGRGVISKKVFMSLLKCKHPINDFGASHQHGVFTHRLQWYLLGQELIDNPKRFSEISGNTESGGNEFSIEQIGELYSKLGDESFQKMFDYKKLITHRTENAIPGNLNATNLWVQIFDRYGYDGYWSVPSTFGFMKALGFFEGLPIRAVPNNPNVCVILEKIKEHQKGDRNISNRLHEYVQVHREPKEPKETLGYPLI